jgi:hypothetical protein
LREKDGVVLRFSNLMPLHRTIWATRHCGCKKTGRPRFPCQLVPGP